MERVGDILRYAGGDLKRTELLRKTPLKRTPFKVKPDGKPKRLRSKGPKMTPIRKSARGQECTLRIPGVCNFNTETTVLCHSPYLSSGRGMGLKAPDEDACYGCSACHDMLDRRVPWPEWMTYLIMEGLFFVAKSETHKILKAKGLIA